MLSILKFITRKNCYCGKRPFLDLFRNYYPGSLQLYFKIEDYIIEILQFDNYQKKCEIKLYIKIPVVILISFQDATFDDFASSGSNSIGSYKML